MKFFLFIIFFLFASCSTQEVEINGNSLNGVLEDGDSVEIDYFFSTPLQRNQIVVINKSGVRNGIIKIIKGVPGDTWEIQNSQIIINGEVLVTTDGTPYSSTRMLTLYAKDYPVIPDNAYLIFGNKPSGSFDSTEFGLISEEQIIGVVN